MNDKLRTMLRRVTDELGRLNQVLRDSLDDDMSEVEQEEDACDATDEMIAEARALLEQSDKDSADANNLARALLRAEWHDVSIGNKLLVMGAIDLLKTDAQEGLTNV